MNKEQGEVIETICQAIFPLKKITGVVLIATGELNEATSDGDSGSFILRRGDPLLINGILDYHKRQHVVDLLEQAADARRKGNNGGWTAVPAEEPCKESVKKTAKKPRGASRSSKKR